MKTQLRMKKVWIIFMFLIVSLAFLITGCSNNIPDNGDESTMEGIIAKIENDQILVVEGVTNEEIKGLSEEDIIKQAQGAAYFEVKQEVKNLKLGKKVKIWIESLDASNPSHGIASKVEILD